MALRLLIDRGSQQCRTYSGNRKQWTGQRRQSVTVSFTSAFDPSSSDQQAACDTVLLTA